MKKSMVLLGFLMLVALSIPTVLFARPYFNDNYEMPNFNSMPCHQNRTERSYEWYYTHLSEEDQLYIDTLFLEALNEADFSSLDIEEQRELIKTIKDDLRTIIIEEGLTIYARR